MASRRRRHRWSRKLRVLLIDHRFNATGGVFGLLALTIGLWLLWSPTGQPQVDPRNVWEQALEAETQTDLVPTGAGGAGSLVSVAKASVSVSAKRGVVGGYGAQSAVLHRPRLARVARTMPEIGPVTAVPPETLPEVASLLPDDLRSGLPDAMSRQDQRAGAADLSAMPNWLRFAAALPTLDDRPMIAVVIDDLGLNRRNTAALNELPAPLTLAFLPYAGGLSEQARAARAAGHELVLHMPMEPVGSEWPGPQALLTSITEDEFDARLIKAFESFDGFVGLNNHMGSRITADARRMARIMTELRRRDLLFLDSKTTARSVGPAEARRHGVPFAQRDVFLDHERIDPEYVLRQLAVTERIARRRGAAIAIGHPHNVTLNALRQWLPTIKDKGFVLVPVSTIVARRSCTEEILMASCGGIQAARPGQRIVVEPTIQG